jgi:hypothetical protein
MPSKSLPDVQLRTEVTQPQGNGKAGKCSPKRWLQLLLCAAISIVAMAALLIVLRNRHSNRDEDARRAVNISGVPVYNYNLRHDIRNTTRVQTYRQLRGQAAYDWILQLKVDATAVKIQKLCTQLPANARCTFVGNPDKGGLPLVVLRATQPELESCLLDHKDLLDHAEADVTLNVAADANAADSEVPWGLDRINARSGLDGKYNSTAKGHGVHVYVADTGIRTTHVDFMDDTGTSRAVPAIEVNEDGIVECDKLNADCAGDDHGHGTHVAGTVGGKTFGVATGVLLHSVKVAWPIGSWR